MPGAIKDLRDDEIIRFQRFHVTESAAATYTEQSYDTQLSIDRGIIWMIHWIEAGISAESIDDPAADAFEELTIQICRESQSAIQNLGDPDTIFILSKQKDRTAAIGTDAGPVILMDSYPIMYAFPAPLAYAAQNIHVGIQSSAAAAKTISGRIAYSMRKVSDKFFYRVAQALIS